MLTRKKNVPLHVICELLFVVAVANAAQGQVNESHFVQFSQNFCICLL